MDLKNGKFLNIYFAILLVVLLGSISLSSSQVNFICPSPSDINPCECTDSILQCWGYSVTQESINNLFAVTRQVNNMTLEDELVVNDVIIVNTTLTSIDLTPLAHTTIVGDMAIQANGFLTTFQSGTNSSDQVDLDQYRFTCASLLTSENGLDESGVNEILKFLNPSQVEFLQFDYSPLSGSQPLNLTSFENLRSLYLYQNQITEIVSGQFENCTKLLSLNYRYNPIRNVNEGAFRMNPPPTEMQGVRLTIDLSHTGIQLEHFHEQSELESTGRIVELVLEYNELEFISQKFEPFLKANELNRLELSGNKFICDERMRWLRDGKDEYEPQVMNVDCTNDPGFNIFTTSLLS